MSHESKEIGAGRDERMGGQAPADEEKGSAEELAEEGSAEETEEQEEEE